MSDIETRPSFCPACGKPTTPDAPFCRYCGAKVDFAKQTTGNMVCASCGHSRTSDAAFCEKCGLHFSAGVQTAAPSDPDEVHFVEKLKTIGAVGLIGLFVILGAVGMRIEKPLLGESFQDARTSSAKNAAHASANPRGVSTNELHALSYVGRMPDLAFFNLPEIKTPLEGKLESEDLQPFSADQWRSLDFSNVELHGHSLTVEWWPSVTDGLIGGILVLDSVTRHTVFAVQNDKPILTIHGSYQSVDPSTLPAAISAWLQKQSSATREVSHEEAKVVFDCIDGLAVAGISNPSTAERFLAMLKSAIASNRKNEVAGLVSYPLLVTLHGQAQKVNTADEFVAKYDRIVDSSVKRAVADTALGDLFMNWKGVMVGNGEVWFAPNERGSLLVTEIHVL